MFQKKVFLQVAWVGVFLTGKMDSNTVLRTLLNSSNHDLKSPLMSLKEKKKNKNDFSAFPGSDALRISSAEAN